MTDQPSGEVILYQREDGAPALQVRLDAETVWVTQAQLVDLFQSSKANISEHIANVFAEGELEREATVRDFRTVRQEGDRTVERTLTHYNLDVAVPVSSGQVLDLDATSSDYDIAAAEKVEFFEVVRDGFHESELKKLNTLVSAHFDAAEFRAHNRQPTLMSDWLTHLDRLITAMDAPTLTDAGLVSHQQAVASAEGEYQQYRARLDAVPSGVENAYLETIKRTQRDIEGKP